MNHPAPARIRALPSHLVDQIKAGEVVERPANVLKELLENALDAGARRVELEIREQGLSLLRVSDDGRGIEPADLELAFGRHATSKISGFEDLYRLNSFGFRGEALPSIASIARVECVSWTADAPQGATIRLEGGVASGVHSAAKSGREHGTVMTVRDLFYNTPARLKFLQSPTSEKNWLKRFLYAFILSRPDVGFQVQWEDEEKKLYPALAAGDHAGRVRQLYGARAATQVRVRENFREWQGLRLKLLLIDDQGARADGPLEHVLVNGRPVLDKALPRVAQQLLERHAGGDPPCVLILLDLPGEEVDVNVHPNKTTVKFHRHGDVLSFLTATLREMLAPAERPLPMDTPSPTWTPAAAQDLSRDREGSYASHLEGFLGGPVSTEAALAPRAVHGPYFLWEDGAGIYYVDGRKLLSGWYAHLASKESESLPLLVSHPLRDWTPSPGQLEGARSAGHELDELEPGFWVLRAIPTWLKGLPLNLVEGLLKGGALPAFPHDALSPGKWREIWETRTASAALEERSALALGPALFKGG